MHSTSSSENDTDISELRKNLSTTQLSSPNTVSTSGFSIGMNESAIREACITNTIKTNLTTSEYISSTAKTKNHQRMTHTSSLMLPLTVVAGISRTMSNSASANNPFPSTTPQLPLVSILRRGDGGQFNLPPAPQKMLRKNQDRPDSDELSASSSADGSMSRTSASNSIHGIIDTPDPVEFQGVFIDPFILKNVSLPKDRPFILKVESEMDAFIRRSHRLELKYPGLNSFERLIVHRLAGFFNLKHVVDRMKTVILSKTPNTEIPPLKLRDIPIDLTGTQNNDSALIPNSQNDETSSSSNSSCNKISVQIMQRNGRTPSNTSSNGRPPVINNSSSSTTSLSPTVSPTGNQPSTFEERQEEYNRARERIFSEPSLNEGSVKNSSDDVQYQPLQPPIRSFDGDGSNSWYHIEQSMNDIPRLAYNTANSTLTNVRPLKGFQSSRPRPQYSQLQHPLPPTPTRSPFNSSSIPDGPTLHYPSNRPYRPQQLQHQYPPPPPPPPQQQQQQQNDFRSANNNATMAYIPPQGPNMNMMPGQQPPSMGYITVQQADGSLTYQPVMSYPAVMPVPVYFPPLNRPPQQQQPSSGSSRIMDETDIPPPPNANFGFAPYPYMMPQQPIYPYPPAGMVMSTPMSDPSNRNSNIGSSSGVGDSGVVPSLQ